MNKEDIIQISEEQAREMWELAGDSWPGSIKNWKINGYIEQSELEKAKEKFRCLMTRKMILAPEVEKYLSELEKEVKRLKGE